MPYRTRLYIVLAGLLGAAGAAFAHPGQHHGGAMGHGDPDRMLERIARHLDLSDTQRQSIENILGAARPELDDLRTRGHETREALRALDVTDPDYHARLTTLATEAGELATSTAMLMGRLRADIAAELTDEQRAEMDEFMAGRGERRRRHRR